MKCETVLAPGVYSHWQLIHGKYIHSSKDLSTLNNDIVGMSLEYHQFFLGFFSLNEKNV